MMEPNVGGMSLVTDEQMGRGVGSFAWKHARERLQDGVQPSIPVDPARLGMHKGVQF